MSCVVNICSRHQLFQCVFQRIDLVLQRLLLSRRQACLLLFQVVNTRFELRSLPNIGSVFRCVRWLFAKGGFGGFLFCVHLAHAWGSLNAFLNQRLVFRRRPKVFEFLNGQFLLFSGKLLRCRVCAFGFDLGFFFKRFFLGNQRVIARLQISQIFRLGAFCCQLLFCFFGALRFDFSRCFVFKARSFSCLGFSGAALKRTTNRRDGPAKHCATNEAVDVLFACFRISDGQPCLQTLKRLLRNFSQAFTAHGHTRLGGVVHSRFAQRLVGDGLGLLGCQLGAHRAEQLAHTGQQRHSGGVNQGLRNGCAKGCGSAGLCQRLACIHLTGKVGASKLARRHSACAQQTQTRSNRGRYWSGQSRKTCCRRRGHVRNRPAKGLSELQEGGFGPAFLGRGETCLCGCYAFFLVFLGFRLVHQPRLTSGQCGFAFESLKACGCGSFEA